MIKKIVNYAVIVWLVLDLLCLPFVFADDTKEVSKNILYNKNELGNFGKVSVASNKEINDKNENILLTNNNLKDEPLIIKKPASIVYFLYYLVVILTISVVKISSKAQVQMGESIAVLMIFLVLMGLGSIFLVNVFSGSVEKSREENLQLKAISIAQKLSFLPELQCSEENIVVEPCIDMLKLNSTPGIINSSMNDYYPLFEYSTITVKKIFPNNTDPEMVVYNKTDKLKPNERKMYIPTALFAPKERAYGFGWITIAVYS